MAYFRIILSHFKSIKFFSRKLHTKQLIYKEWGDPAKVLELKLTDLNTDSLNSDQVLVKWLASPINPADINQVQGVYPVKPSVPAIGGNEGCARVEKLGSNVSKLKVGDYVIPLNAGLGTWTQFGVYDESKLFPIDNTLPIFHAATLQVNPSTAYRILKDFVQLLPGDFIVQNGANSAVGRYVIQICRKWNLKSVNIVRNRDTIDDLKKDLFNLGATEVFTEEEFSKDWRNFKNIKLALNCVSGRSSFLLSKSLAQNGHLVTYGGMSKQPVQVPTGSFIFSDIHLHGFWMSRWLNVKENEPERRKMYSEFSNWIKNGEFELPPLHQIKFGEDFAQTFNKNDNKKQIFIF